MGVFTSEGVLCFSLTWMAAGELVFGLKTGVFTWRRSAALYAYIWNMRSKEKCVIVRFSLIKEGLTLGVYPNPVSA